MPKEAPASSETLVENKSVDYARTLAVLCFKIYNPASAGWPDRLFVFPSGQHVWIEFKKGKEKLRPLQEYRCQQLLDRNVTVYRGVNTYRKAKRIIDKHCGI